MLIKDLLDKQAVLDNFICQNNGYEDCYSKEFYTKRKLALAVEIGEMANETNCFKYWKKNCEIDRDNLIEEIVDCIHFALSLINMDEVNFDFKSRTIPGDATLERIWLKAFTLNISDKILSMYRMIVNHSYVNILVSLVGVARHYNYTAEEIVQAYDKKYEENIARQKRNY